MREINFQEVGMQNYGPYIEPMIHVFTNNTLTLLTGPNGIGKTMSLDAIPFTLFGITSKGARGDDVVNNVVGKDCKTWVKFLVDNTQYKVTRYQKYKRRGNTVVLNINGVDSKSGHREVLPELERILCPAKTFMNTLMFGQKVKDFFTDLGDADKKDIFRKILALEKYLSLYNETASRLKEVMQQASILETDKKVREGRLSEIVKQLEELKELEKQFYINQKNKIEQLKKSISDNEMLLKNWNKTISELNQKCFDLPSIVKELYSIEEKISTLDSKYKSLKNEVDNNANQKKYELNEQASLTEKNTTNEKVETVSQIDEKIQNLKQKLSDAVQKHQNEKHKLDDELLKLQLDNDQNNSRIYEINENVLEKEFSMCPTCEQEVDDKVRRGLMVKIENYKEQITLNDTEIYTISLERKELISKISEYSDEVNKQISDLQENKKLVIKQYEVQILKIKQRIKETFKKVDYLSLEKKSDLDKKLLIEKEQLQQDLIRLTNLKSDAEKHQDKIKSTEKIIESLVNDIELIKINLKDIEEKEFETDQILSYQQRVNDVKSQIKSIDETLKAIAKRQEILDFWKTGFSSGGIPSMLIDEAIPFMNKQVTNYLDMLTNGRYIVSFDTLAETKAGDFRDKISVRVLDTHTQANTRVQLSGGQTRIIDIATILTLGDLQSNIQDVKFNLLLFDEIFDSLDDENIGYVTKVLNKIKIGKSIYVISHQHQDQVEADQNLTMVN